MLPSASGEVTGGGNILNPPVELHQGGLLPCYRRVGGRKYPAKPEELSGQVSILKRIEHHATMPNIGENPFISPFSILKRIEHHATQPSHCWHKQLLSFQYPQTDRASCNSFCPKLPTGHQNFQYPQTDRASCNLIFVPLITNVL